MNVLITTGVCSFVSYWLFLCRFVYQGSEQESLRVCKRGEGGQHGLQLLLLCPQNYLPGCGWESAEGGSHGSFLLFIL